MYHFCDQMAVMRSISILLDEMAVKGHHVLLGSSQQTKVVWFDLCPCSIANEYFILYLGNIR